MKNKYFLGILPYLLPVILISGCGTKNKPKLGLQHQYTQKRQLEEVSSLRVGSYPKSVIFDPDYSKAYVCNLEAGSVSVINAETKRSIKKILFERTAKKASWFNDIIESFEEKPVEITFTGNGRYVWISLLNAGGVAVYDTREIPPPKNAPFKKVVITYTDTGLSKPQKLRFIKTGVKPKIVQASPDGKLVFVANWAGQTISIIDASTYKVKKTVKVGDRPRGICFAESLNKAYIAIFGEAAIAEIDVGTLKLSRKFKNVGKQPRHIVIGNGNTLYVSMNGDSQICEVDITSGQVKRRCGVGSCPRTICLSQNKNFLFVTNYENHSISVVDVRSMRLLLTQKSVTKPIGISFNPSTNTVWVSGYRDNTVKIYSFNNKIMPFEPAQLLQ